MTQPQRIAYAQIAAAIVRKQYKVAPFNALYAIEDTIYAYEEKAAKTEDAIAKHHAQQMAVALSDALGNRYEGNGLYVDVQSNALTYAHGDWQVVWNYDSGKAILAVPSYSGDILLLEVLNLADVSADRALDDRPWCGSTRYFDSHDITRIVNMVTNRSNRTFDLSNDERAALADDPMGCCAEYFEKYGPEPGHYWRGYHTLKELLAGCKINLTYEQIVLSGQPECPSCHTIESERQEWCKSPSSH